MSQYDAILPDAFFLPIHTFLLKHVKTVQPPIKVKKDVPLAEAVRLMATYRLHRLFVVDQDDKPVGVVTPAEVLKKLF